eukprot:10252186-Alexandrium_andersonii.AAC.1
MAAKVRAAAARALPRWCCNDCKPRRSRLTTRASDCRACARCSATDLRPRWRDPTVSMAQAGG